jgi:hypothetical protein
VTNKIHGARRARTTITCFTCLRAHEFVLPRRFKGPYLDNALSNCARRPRCERDRLLKGRGLDKRESSYWELGVQVWSRSRLNARPVVIAYLHRLTSNAHHCATSTKTLVVFVCGIADRLIGAVVARLVSIADGDKCRHERLPSSSCETALTLR